MGPSFLISDRGEHTSNLTPSITSDIYKDNYLVVLFVKFKGSRVYTSVFTTKNIILNKQFHLCLSNFFVSFYNDIYKQNNTKTIRNKTKPKQTKTKIKIKKQIKKNKETKDKHSLRNKKKT